MARLLGGTLIQSWLVITIENDKLCARVSEDLAVEYNIYEALDIYTSKLCILATSNIFECRLYDFTAYERSTTYV